MKKVFSLLTMTGVLGLTMLAGADTNTRMSATACASTGMSPSSSWLNTATSTTNGLVSCSLDLDLAFATIDNVRMWSTTGSSYCSLRSTGGNIIYPNTVTNDIHEWTTDRSISGMGWSVYCNVQAGKRAYFLETRLK